VTRRSPLLVLAALLLVAAPASAQTTTARTIGDANGDDRLEYRAGESHVVREDLAAAQAGRERRRVARLFFAQMTDTHVVDEESPLRVEFLERIGPLSAAHRAHEGVSAQVSDQMVRRLRATRSPVTRRGIELVMTTGDNTDNTQRNETRWMIDVMDGGRVDPDSGVAGACGPEGFHGVRGGGQYYEPDASDGQDGAGYEPPKVRDFPGLLERMNEPFQAEGFGKVPWYAVFGNHDGLVQGNQPRNPALEALATGCTKVTGVPDATAAAIREGAAGDGERAIRALRTAMIETAAAGDPAFTRTVPSDPDRRPLRKEQWIAEHFDTTGLPAGHGFGAENLATGMGNYSFAPRPGLRFIALDTVAEHGLDDGNLDDDQFRWLHAELLKADAARELVVVFAHHGLATMGQPPVSPFVPPGDTGGNLSPLVHYGEGPRNTGVVLPCHATTPEAPATLDETLRCLLLRHPSVVAFVSGHEHNNRVDPVEGAAGQHGFWEVNTASHIDWPQQSRVIDLVDNRDGTLSVFGTIVDHGAAPDPGAGPASADPGRLASISRELAFNDHQATHAEDGDGGGRGSREDRNVELLVPHPWHSAP
jgi:metallophosphoesterase (TIGR03767 family)